MGGRRVSRKRFQYVPTPHERANNPDCMNCCVELPVNESRIWCPNASEQGFYCQMKKDFGSIQFVRPMQEHYNVAAGKVIRTEHQLKEAFKESSARESERLGFEVDFQPVSYNEPALNVTDDGLDSTHNHMVKSGQKESKGKFVF